jgi:hypothetical protein
MTTMTAPKPASPGAVEHRVARVEQAVAHLIAAIHTGAPITAEQATRLRLLVDALPTHAVPAARPTSVPDAPVEGCEECEARGALCVECAADALDLTA